MINETEVVGSDTVEPPVCPFAQDVRLEHDPRYAKLRVDEPVSKVRMPHGGDAWLVTRYEDIKSVLTDSRFRRAPMEGRAVTAATKDIGKARSAILPMTDPPEHTQIRRLVTKAFTVRRIEELRPRVQATADELLDAMEASGGPADLVAALCLPMPITIIAQLLGVPTPDQRKVHSWVRAMLSISDHTPEEVAHATAEFKAYMAEVLEERRRTPDDDLITQLIQVQEEGDRLSMDELHSIVMLLFVAGHESTQNQITNFTYTLLTRPDLWQELLAHPERLPEAIEELLRYLPLGFAGLPLWTAEDVPLANVLIRKGDSVLLAKTSGNRDAAVFDRADEIDFQRAAVPHLAFGHGPHYCIGAQLARMELQVALGTLLRRFPRLQLAVPDEELRWREGAFMRGLIDLPVTW
ncbi:cytochrome P450 [Streptomyces jeddahensis]|uniref:Cytochrome P450 107B1 n=1 Tax=Streptomyces jeddahensis TaxID=1716141 RepID=A0A177HLY4_9ACTN|nr:cytochrome P450 [Streptomyces jeddahensis]OAH11264.1 cytochrome P450 107B1 [Streptomyces jeddahensis]